MRLWIAATGIVVAGNMSGADRAGAPGGVEMGTAAMVVDAAAEMEVGSSPGISDTRCYVAARIERERRRRSYSTRGACSRETTAGGG